MVTIWTVVVALTAAVTASAVDVKNARTVNNETLPFRITFNPLMLDKLPMGAEWPVQVFFQYEEEPATESDLVLGVQVTKPDKAAIPEPLLDLVHVDELPGINVTETENVTTSGNFSVRGVFLGFSNLVFHVCNRSKSLCNDTDFPKLDLETGRYEVSTEWTTLDIKYRVSIMRERKIIDDIFTVAVSIAVFISQIAIGCKTEILVIKEVLKKPIAPIIGFCCQFCIMPPLAFGIGKLVPITPGEAVGMFTIGCSPGGGASNMYSYLLLGDVSLSITMTLISTVASLGMIPLWMFTLGKLLLDDLGMGNVTIPYENIILSLVMVIVPVSIGLIIKWKRPLVAKKIAKIIRPFMFIFLIFMFTFGMYVNAYMFRLFTPMIVLGGFILPLCGFLGGAAVSAACRQPWKRVKTIALETGIQNTGVAILLLLFSLPSPDAELAIVGSVAVSMMTPCFPLILVIGYEIRRRCFRKKKEGDADGEKGKEEPQGFDIYIQKIKKRLPCLKKAGEGEKPPVATESETEMKEPPNGIACAEMDETAEAGKEEESNGNVSVEGDETERCGGDGESSGGAKGAESEGQSASDTNGETTEGKGNETADDVPLAEVGADDKFDDAGEVNLSFVNDDDADTAF